LVRHGFANLCTIGVGLLLAAPAFGATFIHQVPAFSFSPVTQDPGYVFVLAGIALVIVGRIRARR
jgi:hypothetical protein